MPARKQSGGRPVSGRRGTQLSSSRPCLIPRWLLGGSARWGRNDPPAEEGEGMSVSQPSQLIPQFFRPEVRGMGSRGGGGGARLGPPPPYLSFLPLIFP